MSIDLEQLSERHPALPPPLAVNLGFLAALALQRRHAPGVVLEADIDGKATRHPLLWRPISGDHDRLVDAHRATEDGAEAIALGLVHEAHRWVVHRRLQRRQYGDWLVEEETSGRKIVLEVGGLDDGSLTAKLNGELAQVQRSPLPFDRAACVVRFADVTATLVQVQHGTR